MNRVTSEKTASSNYQDRRVRRHQMNLTTLVISLILAGMVLLGVFLRELMMPEAGASHTGVSESLNPSGILSWTVDQQTSIVRDSYGNEVNLEILDRWVVLSPGAAESLYRIGAADRIIAVTESREPIHPAEWSQTLDSVGSVVRPNMEAVLFLEPGLVIVDPMSPNLANSFAAHGIPALVYNPLSLMDILDLMEIMAQLSGRTESATSVIEGYRNLLIEMAARPAHREQTALRGLFLYSTSPLMAFDSRSLPGDILGTLGVQNLTDGLAGSRPILSVEYILQEDPDFLWGAMSLSSIQELANLDSRLSQIRAIRERNLEIVPSTLILRGSPRLIDSLEDLRSRLPQPREEI